MSQSPNQSFNLSNSRHMTATAMTDSDKVIKRAFERPEWYLTKTAYNIKTRIETVKEFIHGREVKSILDIGCGDGSLSLHLLAADNCVTLLDRSKAMLEFASDHVPPGACDRVRVLNGDFMSVDLPEKSYDLILCVGVLAYVENRRAFLSRLASLLSPGGMVIIECTDGSHFITYLIRAYKSFRAKVLGGEFPTVTRPSSELLRMLSELGFQSCGAFRYSLPLPGVRRLLSQGLSHGAIRFVYGTAAHNRMRWLGNECIYHLRREG